MFSDDPHRAPDASLEAVTNQLASWEKILVDVTQEVLTFMNAFAQSLHG